LVEFQNANNRTGTRLKLVRGFPANTHGYGRLKKMIPAICKTVNSGRVAAIMITDLDTTECAPELIRNWFAMKDERPEIKIPEGFLFRIAVREIESWLIADCLTLATFLGISPAHFSASPDSLVDSKAHLLNIIRAKGNRKWHREMLPGRNTRIGPKYNAILCDFIANRWDPERAARISSSLNRTIGAFLKI
jgi:hypothetical protein